MLTRPAGDVAERNRIRGTKRNALGSRAPRLPPEIASTATAYRHVESTPPPPYKSFVRSSESKPPLPRLLLDHGSCGDGPFSTIQQPRGTADGWPTR